METPIKHKFSRQDYFDAYYSVVTPEEFKLVVAKTLEMAKAGDRALLSYVVDRGVGRTKELTEAGEDTQAMAVHVFIPEKNKKEV